MSGRRNNKKNKKKNKKKEKALAAAARDASNGNGSGSSSSAAATTNGSSQRKGGRRRNDRDPHLTHVNSTPLMAAASGGHHLCVSLLINGGAPGTAVTQSGDTAMSLAAAGGHDLSVLAMLDADPDTLEGSPALNAKSPLAAALYREHYSTVKILATMGASIDVVPPPNAKKSVVARIRASVPKVLQDESRWRRRRALLLVREQRRAARDLVEAHGADKQRYNAATCACVRAHCCSFT